jgi:hypothetical protein
MSSLDDSFAELSRRLRETASLAAAKSDPFYYFVYAPSEALEVKRRVPLWSVGLENAGLKVHRVSFSELLWDLIDASGLWDELLANEPGAEPKEVNQSIAALLGNGLVERVAAIVAGGVPGEVVFLTDTEMLHPYFRVRTLESALHDRVKVPTVVFYPGRRVGQYGLSFLGFYPEDGNYRATLIGGLP